MFFHENGIADHPGFHRPSEQCEKPYIIIVLTCYHNPPTTKEEGTFMEISSQTPRFVIAELRSLISSPESTVLAITSWYVSLFE